MIKPITNFAAYFGIKVASKPCFLAIALTTSRVKVKLSAALVQTVYFKTSSNWPFPASACNYNTKKISSKVGPYNVTTGKEVSSNVFKHAKEDDPFKDLGHAYIQIVHVCWAFQCLHSVLRMYCFGRVLVMTIILVTCCHY